LDYDILLSSGIRFTEQVIIGGNVRRIILVTLVILILLAVSLSMAGCSINKADVFFPTQKESGTPQMEVLGRGWLVYQGGCLRITPFYYFGKGELIIWPYGYGYEVAGREVRVLNQDGKVVARSGHWIKVGGGLAANKEIAEKIYGQPIPEDKYPGPYFICGEVVD
jgi:hypothetical protein